MGTIEENIAHDHGAYCLQHLLAKLPDELFQGVIKYMGPRNFLNLKQTSQDMYKRCSAYESSVIFWLDKVKINLNNSVQFFAKGEPLESDAFLTTKFKLLIDTVQVHNLGNSEATVLCDIVKGKEIRAGQLYAVNAIHCSSRLFKDLITRYSICKIICSSMIPRLQTDEIMQKELADGKRHINSWCLEKCYFEEVEPEKVVKILFRTWKMIKPEDEAGYITRGRRPYVVMLDEFCFKLVSINEFEFIINTACGVLIERKFPNENDEMVEDEEE